MLDHCQAQESTPHPNAEGSGMRDHGAPESAAVSLQGKRIRPGMRGSTRGLLQATVAVCGCLQCLCLCLGLPAGRGARNTDLDSRPFYALLILSLSIALLSDLSQQPQTRQRDHGLQLEQPQGTNI